jgi:hypothetical protein
MSNNNKRIVIFYFSKKHYFLVKHIKIEMSELVINHGISFEFVLFNRSDENSEFFMEIISNNYLNNKSPLDVVIDNYLLKDCFIKRVCDTSDGLTVSLCANTISINDRPVTEYENPIMERIEDLMYTEKKNLLKVKKNLDYFISVADSNEEMLEEIERELNYYLYDYDIYFDKKLAGEIKYIYEN